MPASYEHFTTDKSDLLRSEPRDGHVRYIFLDTGAKFNAKCTEERRRASQ